MSTKTPEQIAEQIMSGWTWDGMPPDQLNAVRYFAIAAIATDRAQRGAEEYTDAQIAAGISPLLYGFTENRDAEEIIRSVLKVVNGAPR